MAIPTAASTDLPWAVRPLATDFDESWLDERVADPICWVRSQSPNLSVEPDDTFFGNATEHQILSHMSGSCEDFYYFGDDELLRDSNEEDGLPVLPPSPSPTVLKPVTTTLRVTCEASAPIVFAPPAVIPGSSTSDDIPKSGVKLAQKRARVPPTVDTAGSPTTKKKRKRNLTASTLPPLELKIKKKLQRLRYGKPVSAKTFKKRMVKNHSLGQMTKQDVGCITHIQYAFLSPRCEVRFVCSKMHEDHTVHRAGDPLSFKQLQDQGCYNLMDMFAEFIVSKSMYQQHQHEVQNE